MVLYTIELVSLLYYNVKVILLCCLVNCNELANGHCVVCQVSNNNNYTVQLSTNSGHWGQDIRYLCIVPIQY